MSGPSAQGEKELGRRTALVVEPSVPLAGALRRYLEGAGFEVTVTPHAEEAMKRALAGAVEVVFTSSSATFDGEGLCALLKRRAPALPVVLVYPPDEEDPSERAAKAGADAHLMGPLKRATVASTARTMVRLKDLVQTVERLEADLKKHVAEPPKDLQKASGSTADHDFFKKFLLMEVKRSRRYRYPVSFLVVAIDHFAARTQEASQAKRAEVLTEALGAITRAIRDIDQAVPFTEDRFLVFLPHTPREGALVVAARLHEKISRCASLENMTASVGVASFDPAAADGSVSFGRLMKEATEALRRAQLAGGDRIDAAGERKSKRDRVSIG
ncbi:MAG: diguanylate cyclase [Myxococcales bacterium]|nr:diguanylate cyclase [Myxococcales bacterium]